jgi:hypothetical protein
LQLAMGMACLCQGGALLSIRAGLGHWLPLFSFIVRNLVVARQTEANNLTLEKPLDVSLVNRVFPGAWRESGIGDVSYAGAEEHIHSGLNFG